MKITNKYNLPEPYVKAVSAMIRKPEPGRISITQLIDSPQILYLRMKHWDDIEEDASERVWALLGSTIHYILERNARGGEFLVEEGLEMTIDNIKITGRPDLLDHTGVLSDWKITSVWSYVYGKKEWETQLQCYAYLYTQYGFKIEKIRNIMIFRDWKESQKESRGYPPIPIYMREFPLPDLEKVKEMIDGMLKRHLAEEKSCTDEECWMRPETYAVMKNGRKTAVRVFETKEDAEKYLSELDDKHYIERRPGERIRCLKSCNVSKFCPQWQKEKK